MFKYLSALFLIPTFASSLAFAAYSNCRWTAEGTNDAFESEPLYKQSPKLVAPAACSSNAAGSSQSDVAPTCLGQLYCESSSSYAPPQVVMAGCLAVKVNGRWACPDAQTCMADRDVIVQGLNDVPAPAVPSSSRRQNSGGSEAMDGPSSSQGGGGR